MVEPDRTFAAAVVIASTLRMPVEALEKAAIALLAGDTELGGTYIAQAKFSLDRLLDLREEGVTDEDFAEAVERFKAFMARAQNAS